MPMYRRPVNKSRSAANFRSKSKRTKAANMKGLARGGWML